MALNDLYARLGVTRDASETEIKAAFRHQAKSAHPDFGGDPEAFRQLKAAYDILSDPDKRHHYDMTGDVPPDAADQARFHALVGDWLVAAVLQAGAPQFDDVLALMNKSVRQHIAGVEQQIVQLRRVVVKMGAAAERLHSDTEQNLLQALLHERQKQVEETIHGLEDQRAKLAQILVLLDHYSYEIFVESVP